MDERYAKNIPAISPEEQEILKSKRIFIAGAGGLGGYTLEFMLRSGIGEISIADGDRFTFSNLNRQLLAVESNIGCLKVSEASKRAALVNPAVRLSVIPEYIDFSNAEELISGFDAVLDCLDNPESRKLLYSECEKKSIPYIYAAVSGFTAQAAVLLPGAELLDKLYGENFKKTEDGILSFTPAVGAAMEVSLCLRVLLGKTVESGRLYCADLLNMDFQNFLID